MESILTSIKKLLGISPEYTNFDSDIIMHINTVFMLLNQLGVGPDTCFSIEDDLSTWNDFVTEDDQVPAIKSYMYLKVKLLFDPPMSSAVIEANKQLINELEWRLSIQTGKKSGSNAGSNTGGEGEIMDYSTLTNKPRINGVELNGNKTSGDLKMYNSAEIDEKIARIENALQNIILDYIGMTNKPKINGVELSGNKTSGDLNMYTSIEVDQKLAEVRSLIENYVPDYTIMTNKPSINNVELNGNKTSGALSMYTSSEVDAKINVVKNAINNYVPDYAATINKPSINGVELSGNKTSGDLSMYTSAEIDTKIGTVDQALADLTTGSGV